MPIITPDFTEVETRPQWTTPEGTFKARIFDAQETTSKEGNPYIKWTLKLFGCEETAAQWNDLTVFYNTPTTGKGAFRLQNLMKAIQGDARSVPFDTQDYLGKEIQVLLVKRVMPDGSISKYPDVKTVSAIS